MKKDFIVSKIEALQDGSQYVLVAFTDRNEVEIVIHKVLLVIVVKQYRLPLQKT